MRTLQGNTKIEALLMEFRKTKLEILGVCENRWADNGEHHTTFEGENFSFLFSGKPLAETRESGVGLILSSSSRRALMDWNPVSD